MAAETTFARNAAEAEDFDDLTWCKPKVNVAKIEEILDGVDEAAYRWDLKSDHIRWSDNAHKIMGVSDTNNIATGRNLARLFDPENMATPHSTIMSTTTVDQGEGVYYQIEYAIMPKGKESSERIWIEDTGRWFVGEDGRPSQAAGLIRKVNERYEQQQKLNFLARYDELTGHYNRTALNDVLQNAIKRTSAEENPCAFFIVSIDNLGMINNNYGFDVADSVIKAIGDRLSDQLRTGDAIGRHSGAKFGIVLLNCKENTFDNVSERLMAAVREAPVMSKAGPISVTISIGAVALPRYADSASKAMICAQDALEEAKRKHRDSFASFQQSMRRDSDRKRNIELADEILTALNDGRIEIVFQPVVEARTGEVGFYETLVRMRQTDGTLMPAYHFMMAAEKLGLTHLIDHRVLNLTAEALQGRPNIRVSVNISAATMDDPVWLDHLRSMFQICGVRPEQIIIEITETTAIEDIEESNQFLGVLHGMGCRVAIDDFGAGYTSFRNLRHLDVDILKIDGAFVDELHNDKHNQYFVRSLIDLAKNFNLSTVAELVSDQRDADLLIEYGIDYLQGYLYGEPENVIEPTSQFLEPEIRQKQM